MLLSVIIPVFKVEDTLEKCVNSVITQKAFKDGNVEIILVDDGSPDKSGNICDKLATEYQNIKVIHQENGGLSNARNSGIKIANGKYIQLLDSDDYLFPNSLNNILKEIENEPDVIILRYKEFDLSNGKFCESGYYLDNTIVSSNKGEMLLSYIATGRKYNWYAWLNVVKREYLINNNLYFEDGRLFEDVLWTQPVLYNAKSISYIDEPIYCYIINRAGTISRYVSEKSYNDKMYSLHFTEDFCNKNNFSKETKTKLVSNLSQVYVSLLADNFLMKKENRKRNLKELKGYSYILKNSKRLYQRLLYIASKIVGLKIVSYVLHIRAQYVRHSKKV